MKKGTFFRTWRAPRPARFRRRWARLLGAVVLTLATAATAATPAEAGTTVSEATVEQVFPFAGENPCLPTEQVVLSARIKDTFKITVDNSGGIHIDDYYSVHGSGSGFDVLTDPGLLTPVADYVLSDDQLQSTNFAGPTFDYNSVFYTRVIRLGETAPADDAYLRSQIHMTMNANGVFTASFERPPTLECR